MPSLNADQRLRPTRIGFLVRPSNLPNLRKVFQICSCLWGGMYNPIIPVSRSLPAVWRRGPYKRPSGYHLARGYIRFFEPDVFVETEPGLAQSVGIADDTATKLYPRVISLDDLVSVRKDSRPEFAFGLDIFDVYQELYQSEFRFVPRHGKFIALFGDRGRHNAYIDATFGGFPEHEALAYIQQAYKDAFDPTVLKHEPSAWLRLVKENGRTPLAFTRHGLEELSNSGWDPTIFVANPTSSLDLIDLWNLRLVRPNVLPVNSEWLPALRDYLRDFIAQNHRPLPGNPNGVMIHTTVEIGNSFSEEEANDLVRSAFTDLPDRSWARKLWYDHIWDSYDDDHIPRPSPVQIYAKSSQLDLSVAEEGPPSIQFQSLAPDFAAEYGGSHARWVNVISLTDFSDQRLALTLPSTAVSSPSYHLYIGGLLLVSREGFVLTQHFKQHRVHLQLLSGTEAVIDWFKRHGIVATASDAGRVADQILSSVGGFWGTSLFQDKNTLVLLDKMSKSRRPLGEDAIEEYPDRTASVGEWQGVAKRRENGVWKAETYLDRLVEAGALKLGLSVSCPNCKKKNWYGLDALAEQVSCERCLKIFSFPQGSLNFQRSPWEFRVAGPYSVPDFANGAYATVLALKCMADGEGLDRNSITFSTNLDLKLNGDCLEIDLACWFQQKNYGFIRQDEPVFVVGEAKSFAQNSFSEEDVARLKRVGEKMPGTFLVFATLKSELSDTERVRIARLAKWGRLPSANNRPRNPVIVLTGTELFASRSVSEAWREAGGKRQALAELRYVQMDNLRTLADLTQQVYLGLQPMFEWLDEYWKRRHERRTQHNTSVGS